MPLDNRRGRTCRNSTLIRPRVRPTTPSTGSSSGASSSNELSDDELSSDRSSTSNLSDDVSENCRSSDFDSDEESSIEYNEGNTSHYIVLRVKYDRLKKVNKIKPESTRVKKKEDRDPLGRRNIENVLPEPRNLDVIIIDDEPPRAQKLWDVPAYVGEPALRVRPCKVRWIPSGEIVLMLVVADFREFKATLEALTDQEVNEKPFSNGLKYSIAGIEEELMDSADHYKIFREKLASLEDSRSSTIGLRPVMEPAVCKIHWGPTAETFLMAAFDDFNAFRMTLKALADGGGAGYAFRRGLRYTIDGGRELMLTNAKQYYAFLQALAKMPTKREVDCPGIVVWPLATGPDFPWKREEYTNLTSKHAVLQLTERSAQMEACFLPSGFSRKRSTSPTASMAPAGKRERR